MNQRLREDFSSNVLQKCLITTDWKYENAMQTTMGNELTEKSISGKIRPTACR